MSVHLFLGIFLGGLFGYGLYFFIGCTTGACPITANPWISTIVGAGLGAMISKFN